MSPQPVWKAWATVMTGLFPTLVVMQNAVLPAAYARLPALDKQPRSVKMYVSVAATVAIMVSTAVPLSSRLLGAVKFNPFAIASIHAGMVGGAGLALGDFRTG